jgi:hypothetical protein
MAAELPLVRPPATMPEGYYDAYCVAGHMHLSTRECARTWWALGVGAEIAGAYARQGITPEQAMVLMDEEPQA